MRYTNPRLLYFTIAYNLLSDLELSEKMTFTSKCDLDVRSRPRLPPICVTAEQKAD